MNIDFSKTLLDLDGKPMTDGQRDSTLGMVVVHVLLSPEVDANAALDQKLERGMLAQKIYKAGPVDLTVEQVALIKDLLGQANNLAPLALFRAFEILDPAEVGLHAVS